MSKFETLDFCFDMLDELRARKIKHFAIFLQVAPKTNKFHISNSDFTLQEVRDYIPKIVAFCIDKIMVGYMESSFKFVNETCNILRKLEIQYILVTIHNDNVELSYYIMNKESLILSALLLNSIPEHIIKKFKTIDNNPLDEEDDDDED